MAETFRYNGVGFNIEVVKSMTFDEFVNHQMHTHHYIHLPPDQKRETLESVYKNITGYQQPVEKVKKVKKEKPIEPLTDLEPETKIQKGWED